MQIIKTGAALKSIKWDDLQFRWACGLWDGGDALKWPQLPCSSPGPSAHQAPSATGTFSPVVHQAGPLLPSSALQQKRKQQKWSGEVWCWFTYQLCRLMRKGLMLWGTEVPLCTCMTEGSIGEVYRLWPSFLCWDGYQQLPRSLLYKSASFTHLCFLLLHNLDFGLSWHPSGLCLYLP